MSVYTMGIWLVKPGSEDEFVTAWQEMAEWTMREVAGAQPGATLLRDRAAHPFHQLGTMA